MSIGRRGHYDAAIRRRRGDVSLVVELGAFLFTRKCDTLKGLRPLSVDSRESGRIVVRPMVTSDIVSSGLTSLMTSTCGKTEEEDK